MKLKRIDHVGVIVDDLAEAESFVRQLGLELSREFEADGRLKGAFFDCGDARIELIEIIDPEERAARLGSDRARIEHIGIEVENLSDTMTALAGLGVTFTAPPLDVLGTVNVWTRPETCDGVMYQFMQPAGSADASADANG